MEIVPSWYVSSTMKGLSDLQLFDTTAEKDFADTTYAAFTANLIGADCPENILQKTARFFNIRDTSDLINKLKWLGFFNDQRIDMIKGTNADILVDMMIRKMSYAPLEKDMVIIHNEIIAKFPTCEEKRVSTLLVKSEPGGDSAMSRAVSLPAAIASKLILEGKIRAKGVQRPTLRAIYQPVLDEMSGFGYRFKDKTIKTDRTVP
jgi:saccharopine dehydrogenase (NADP+, L-glutamate forming)